MNLYLRYFEKETLVQSVDEAIDFLASIPEIGMTEELNRDLREYVASDIFYPKRYKVRPRIYFIVIKTEAQTMADFKAKKAVRIGRSIQEQSGISPVLSRLTEERHGWYEGTVDFKRVITSPSTGKSEYRDTRFIAQCKAYSPQDCYDRIIDHLSARVDPRSQFPSAKGKNFRYKFLGNWK